MTLDNGKIQSTGFLSQVRPKVLAVDDMESNLKLLTHILLRDYDVYTAVSGQDALALINEVNFDIILLDIIMPEMDGFEILKRIRLNKQHQDVPVIFLTANSNAENERIGLDMGASDYILKPFNANIVKLRIRNNINRNSLKKYLELSLASADQGIWEWSLTDDQVFFNQLAGLDIMRNHDDSLFITHWENICHPEDVTPLYLAAQKVTAGESGLIDMDVRILDSDGNWVWCNIYGKSVYNTVTTSRYIQGIYRNINHRKIAETALRESEERLGFVMEATGEGVWDWDIRQSLVMHNKAWCRILGLEDGYLFHHVDIFKDLIHPDDKDRVLQKISHCLEGNGDYQSEHRMRHASGRYLWVIDRGRVVKRTETGAPLRMIGSLLNNTDNKEREDKIANLAYFDQLTNLPNRRLMLSFIQKAIHDLATISKHCAVMFVDIDNFKTLNDTLGHRSGDLLLSEIANRINQVLEYAGCQASRFGGDEFVILLDNLSANKEEAQASALSIARQLQRVLNEKYHLMTHEYSITPSIGITLFNQSHLTVEQVLSEADTAMYHSKISGKNRITFFEHEMSCEQGTTA
ncbi:GGDEF domain-containing response regulator [Leeia oryzae]|uniref:GGDEF domain-containing response regulator n=1 Tax=Leeia oryzae TaxID=356662 RepID=UPI00035DC4FD|nr:diguanylate cyclase [Leeia oryzae]